MYYKIKFKWLFSFLNPRYSVKFGWNTTMLSNSFEDFDVEGRNHLYNSKMWSMSSSSSVETAMLRCCNFFAGMYGAVHFTFKFNSIYCAPYLSIIFYSYFILKTCNWSKNNLQNILQKLSLGTVCFLKFLTIYVRGPLKNSWRAARGPCSEYPWFKV